MMERKQSRAHKSRQLEAEEEEEEEVEEDRPREEELDTYAVIPPNGGWGWVVVCSAFYCNFVVDGILLTFGVILGMISKSFDTDLAEVALAGSLMFGMHLIVGPICAGLSRVFGLRPVAILGSLLCSFSIAISSLATGCWFLYISYGIFAGMGLGMIYMNALVITSVYFTTLMPIALAIVLCGTGIGTMVFAGAGYILVEKASWQSVFLLQAAMAGSMVFAAVTFRPLKPHKVELVGVPPPKSATEDRPDSEELPARRKTIFIKTNLPGPEGPVGSATSLTSYQSMIWNFAEESVVSKSRSSRCPGCRRKRRKRPVDDVIVLSELKLQTAGTRRDTYVEKEPHHGGNAESGRLPEGREVFTKLTFEEKRQKRLAVVKKTIAAMLDCHLMGSFPFVLFTISTALQMAGFLIVFLYEKGGVEVKGGTNVIWRLLLGGLASLPKVNCRILAVVSTVIGGMAMTFSGFDTSIYYHFGACMLFGLGSAAFAILRIMLLVELVGKEKIENATGINLLFMGITCIASPPFTGWLMTLTESYDMIYMVMGMLCTTSGMMLMGLKKEKA